jgi:hypothetical protein
MTNLVENRPGWPPDFAWDGAAGKVLADIDAAFAECQAPDHFTNHTHCEECEEHDTTLRSSPRETIEREALGHAGWDPICFAHPQGVAHMIPALARYAMAPDHWNSHDWYGAQLLFHLTSGGQENRLREHFSSRQCEAIAALLAWLELNRMPEIETYLLSDDLLAAIDLWKA